MEKNFSSYYMLHGVYKDISNLLCFTVGRKSEIGDSTNELKSRKLQIKI
jgi:hypothetical protein